MIIYRQPIHHLPRVQGEAIDRKFVVLGKRRQFLIEFFYLLIDVLDLVFVRRFLVMVSGADGMTVALVRILFGIACGSRCLR